MEKKKRMRKVWRIVIPIVAILIIVRIILPYVIVHYVNKKLSSLDEYYGHIDDIDLNLYRGAYIIKDFYLEKVDTISKEHLPFISFKAVDLSIEWKSLFHGRIVGELDITEPVVCFTKDKVEPADIQNDTLDFRKALKKFMPLKINYFKISDGKLQFIDPNFKPKIDVAITNIQVVAENLSSVQDSTILPSTVNVSADIYKGNFNLKMEINPLANSPTFDLNAELENTSLPDLNDFLKAYAKFDVHTGSFGLFTEVASKNGKFVGYVKPVIKNLKVKGSEDRHDSFLNKLYESLVGATGVVLKNSEEKQVATKIPFEANYEETTVETWYALLQILRNAFVQALYPAIDNEITILSVDKVETEKEKGVLEKLLTKDN
ncbi:MAG: DUF748 domain-containing protein [Bacteroidales bacterium]|nr:DUF748 domain-containing protein [Bacteroidales bacterium]